MTLYGTQQVEGRYAKMTLAERILIRLGIAPKPMFDVAYGIGKAKTILVGNKLGIFEKLSGGPLSAQELAAELDISEYGLSLLLDALWGVGYLERNQGKYKNAKVAQKWLVESSPQYTGNLLRHIDDLWESIGWLDEAVKAGKPVRNFYDYLSKHPTAWRNYTLGQRDIAKAIVGEIVSKVKLPPQARTLLDLGGAHGYYSVAFCRKYPDLTALVIDFESPVAIGQEVVNQEGTDERVSFKVGNYINDDIGSGYDVALLSSIVHGDPPDTNIATMKKVYGALNPGGIIVINEILSYRGKKESESGLLFALNMLVNTPRGKAYSYDVVRGWLRDAGFTSIRRVDLKRLPAYSLLLATRPT